MNDDQAIIALLRAAIYAMEAVVHVSDAIRAAGVDVDGFPQRGVFLDAGIRLRFALAELTREKNLS